MATGTGVQPTIFREYIAVNPGVSNFPDHIINQERHRGFLEVQYIWAFAKEVIDEATRRGTGEFIWDVPVFNAENVQRLRASHKNVKVVISIGGRGRWYSFNPIEAQAWVNNAVDSLRRILRNFGFDGIDVNYENINPGMEAVFADNIGQVIRALKQQDGRLITSIAPSNRTQDPYFVLFQNFGNFIDWVDYQFYDEIVPNIPYFESLYKALSLVYHKKLLPGFSTDPWDHGGISAEVFLQGCLDLFREELLPGIFLWNGYESRIPIHLADFRPAMA